MDKRIEKIKKFREVLLTQVNELSADHLNEIPSGFRNNIIWNLGHMICAQQGVCYLRSANKTIVAEKHLVSFLTNTKPERNISIDEIEEVTMYIRSYGT